MENSVMLNAVCNEPVSLKVVQEPFYRKGFSPFVNKETGTWWEYDDDKKGFFDTGIIAQGRDGNDYVITEQDYNTIVERTLSNVNPTLDEKLLSKLPKSPTDWEPWTPDEQAAARERMGIPDAYALVNEITLEEEVGFIHLNKTASGENYNFSDVIILVEAPNKDNPTCYITINGISWAGGMIRNSAKYHYLRIGVDGGRNRFEYALGNDSSSLVSVNTLIKAMAWYPINKISEIEISRLASTNIPKGMTFKVYAR